MKLVLYKPTSSGVVNQAFGGNPTYYAKFNDQFGKPLRGHDGIDFQAAHATPLYAVCDGVASYQYDNHGGDGIYLRPYGLFDYKDTQSYFQIIYWHLCSKDDAQFKPLIPTDGSWVPVKAGDLIGYSDNSGAPYESSGDHLHFGLVPLNKDGTCVEPANGYNGRIDPMPYFNNVFAGVAKTVQQAATVMVSEADLISNEIVAAPSTTKEKSYLLTLLNNAIVKLASLLGYHD